MMGQLEEPELRKQYDKETLMTKIEQYEEVSAKLNEINYHLREATFRVEESVKEQKKAEKRELEKKRDRIFKERMLRWTIINNIPCDYYCRKIQYQDSHKEIGKKVPEWDQLNQFNFDNIMNFDDEHESE